MPKKLEQLTPDQELLLPLVRDEWLAHGLSIQPAHRTAAENGVAAAYRAAGLTPPRIVVWLGSPMSGAIGAAMLANLPKNCQVWDQVGDQVRAQVWDQVGDQVWAQVRDQVGDQVGDQVRDQVRDQVWAQVRDQVGAQVRDQVGAQVWAQVGDQVRDQVGDQVGDQVYKAAYGQHDAGWLSFYDVMRRIPGIQGPERLEGLTTVARNAGWWWPFRGAVVLTDRPDQLHRDQLGRLHCESGPALHYRDGWGFHAWHGRRVPAWVVEKPTVEAIAAERNAEVRRCGIESLGWPQFIQAAELKPVDACPDPGNPGQDLALYDVPERLWGERVRVLVCVNGTVERDGARRTFGLTVPTELSTALDAAGWGYGLTAREYAAALRRS